ncbi:hypothetical protein QOT17_011497 [Balamuthia mandrillaris]
MRGAVAFYRQMLHERPVLTNGLTAAALMSVGDVIAQTVRLRNHTTSSPALIASPAPSSRLGSRFDAQRNMVMTSWGGFFFGPTFYYWFRFLDRKLPAKGLKVVLLKVSLTATLIAPPFNALFFAWTTTMEHLCAAATTTTPSQHKPTPSQRGRLILRDIFDRWRNDLGRVCVNSAGLWGVANTLNWCLLPNHMRTAFSSVVSVAWNAYLSLVQHRKHLHVGSQPGSASSSASAPAPASTSSLAASSSSS